MKFDRTGRVREKFTAQTERIRRQLDHSGLCPVGLTAAIRPTEGRFGGLGYDGDEITCVRIVYGDGAPGGAWASVATERRAGRGVAAEPLRAVIERNMRRSGDQPSAVEWTDLDAAVIVDDQHVAGRIVRAGGRWWAARCTRGDVDISVVARDWHPPAIAVESVADVVPMLDQLGVRRASVSRPGLTPAAPPGEPHRALLDAALRQAEQRAQWPVDDQPGPEPPEDWSALWRAAVARQAVLSGQSESDADLAVSGMVNQVVALYHEVSWFRRDGGLRARAVAETLLVGTGISDRVASAAAQEAWHRLWVVGADGPARVALRRHWRDAWNEWAKEAAGGQAGG